ncbi:hypothetical protein CEXT_416851, partial [Caerostris extrusa]
KSLDINAQYTLKERNRALLPLQVRYSKLRSLTGRWVRQIAPPLSIPLDKSLSTTFLYCITEVKPNRSGQQCSLSSLCRVA